jgi:cobalt/nickel transport system permease protein
MSLSAIIHQDYEYALLIFLRANTLIFFTLIIFYDKTLFDIAASLQTLKLPDKLVALFFFVGKFIIIIKEEFRTTTKAMKTRNFKSKSNIFSYKIYANIIGIMIVKCFDRADKLKSSIILRNFQGKIYQSKIDKISKIDLLILFSVLVSIFLRIGEITL